MKAGCGAVLFSVVCSAPGSIGQMAGAPVLFTGERNLPKSILHLPEVSIAMVLPDASEDASLPGQCLALCTQTEADKSKTAGVINGVFYHQNVGKGGPSALESH